ncbi:hypothetical protein GTR00_00625 [Kineococcus sp. T90]|nr:hypothetical protein [Kineococcus indalonis]
MTQAEAVHSWWADADQTTRNRALCLREDDLLPADMQQGPAMAGVTVVPIGRSPVDGEPEGYERPTVVCRLLQRTRELY